MFCSKCEEWICGFQAEISYPEVLKYPWNSRICRLIREVLYSHWVLDLSTKGLGEICVGIHAVATSRLKILIFTISWSQYNLHIPVLQINYFTSTECNIRQKLKKKINLQRIFQPLKSVINPPKVSYNFIQNRETGYFVIIRWYINEILI